MMKRIPIADVCIIGLVLTHLIYVLCQWHNIPFAHGLPVGQTDPDTWLRLTLVRDWLAGGSWYDHLVHHSNAGLPPIASPWTRPVDLVLAFFVHLQPSDVDLSLRILRASLLLPVLWMGLMFTGMLHAIRRICPLPAAYVMATLLVITEPGVWNYFLIGNADHHAPLAALFVWVLVGIVTPTPSRRLMAITGLLFALQLWISVETLILIGATYAYFGLSWLITGDRTKLIDLSRLATATAFFSLIALLIERPSTQWLTPIYDSISIVYLTALILCALTAWMLRLAPARTQRDRNLISFTAASLLLCGIAFTFPHLIAGPTYGVDPFILTDFLPRITEARPFYKVPVIEILPIILVPLTAMLVCLAPWIEPKRAFYPHRTSAMLAFFVIFTTLMYYSQQRWSYYMLPVSIIALAPLLGAMFTPENPLVSSRWPASTLVGLTPQQQMKRRLPVLLALLCTPFMLLLAHAAPELMRNTVSASLNAIAPAANTVSAQTQWRNDCYLAARQLIRSGELDRVLPKQPQTILAPTDLGTELLFFTPHNIIASNYHREGAGIKYVWATDAITDEKALRTRLRERHIDAILACPKIQPEEGSLLQAYVNGKKMPSWLHRINYQLPQETAPATPLPKVLLLLVNVQNQ